MENQNNNIFDTIIIGAGAAGLTAAIYSARRTLKTLIISKDIGGQTATATEIENYPGFDLISGPELMDKFKKQAEKNKTQFANGEISKIEQENEIFKIKTSSEEFLSKTVILAFGLEHRELGIPGEKEFKGRGVSYCATCDASFFKNKTVAVVGGGNSALDAAELLSKIAAKIYLIHRRDKFKGEQILIDRVNQAKNIEIIMNKQVLEIKGNNKLNSILIADFPNKKSQKEIKVDGLFIEIGYVAKTDWLKDLVKLNEKGEIIVSADGETSVPGIFAAGDITTISYKQIVISAGEGAKAALQSYRYLQSKKGFMEIGDWGTKK
jgi:thioredoxin reductase (NADPH)